jgi:hypothetical protein
MKDPKGTYKTLITIYVIALLAIIALGYVMSTNVIKLIGE